MSAFTRKTFCEAARLFDSLSVEQIGGYDTGTYCKFRGAMRPGVAIGMDFKVGDHVVRPWGFCSETIQMSRREILDGRTGSGIVSYQARESAQLRKYQRWVAHAALTTTKEPTP